jgi:hypothetical protein
MNKENKENKSMIIKCYLDDFEINTLIDSSVTKVPLLRYPIN